MKHFPTPLLYLCNLWDLNFHILLIIIFLAESVIDLSRHGVLVTGANKLKLGQCISVVIFKHEVYTSSHCRGSAIE